MYKFPSAIVETSSPLPQLPFCARVVGPWGHTSAPVIRGMAARECYIRGFTWGKVFLLILNEYKCLSVAVFPSSACNLNLIVRTHCILRSPMSIADVVELSAIRHHPVTHPTTSSLFLARRRVRLCSKSRCTRLQHSEDISR